MKINFINRQFNYNRFTKKVKEIKRINYLKSLQAIISKKTMDRTLQEARKYV